MTGLNQQLNPSGILHKDQESGENAVKAGSHLFHRLFSIPYSPNITASLEFSVVMKLKYCA